MKPYTYIIGWTKYNKYYYGVQYGLTADPENLWKKYYTSSLAVKEFRKTYGEPDLVQIRRVFECPEKAKNWELKVLQRMKVVLREDFLNQNAAFAPPVNNRGMPPETRQKISESLKGKPKSKEHAEKCRNHIKKLQKQNIEKRKGKTLEEIYGIETAKNMREKIKQARKEQIIDKESYQKAIDTRRKNGGWKPHSESTKDKISQAIAGKKKYNNGEVNKYFTPGEQPNGFIPGFIKRK